MRCVTALEHSQEIRAGAVEAGGEGRIERASRSTMLVACGLLFRALSLRGSKIPQRANQSPVTSAFRAQAFGVIS
jgi:hypothetical protein